MADIGLKTEAVILAELVKLDYAVLIPFGHNHRYDLLIDLGGNNHRWYVGQRFLRVQCKTGKLTNGVIRFNGCSNNNYTGESRRYEGEVDDFMVYCPDTDKVYRMSVDEAGLKPYLRVDPTKNGQTKGIRWAEDYELRE